MKDSRFDDVETTQLTIFENDSPILGLQYLHGTQDGAPDVARRPPAKRIQEALCQGPRTYLGWLQLQPQH